MICDRENKCVKKYIDVWKFCFWYNAYLKYMIAYSANSSNIVHTNKTYHWHGPNTQIWPTPSKSNEKERPNKYKGKFIQGLQVFHKMNKDRPHNI